MPHYTPEPIVAAMWEAVYRLGFRGGAVLEPGCGTGIFLAMMPDECVSSSVLTGVERDPDHRQDRPAALPARRHPPG